MIKIKRKKFGLLGNNCYLITDEATNKSALVDCTEFSDKMVEFIGDADLEYILLTHGHFDHIGGVCDTKQKYGCKVVISAPDEIMLGSSKESLAAYCKFPHKDAEADVIVFDNDKIMLGETEIKVMYTPGHTAGSVCYIVGDNIFAGDTLFKAGCGRTDLPTGSQSDMQNSINKIMKLDGDYNIYTGHGMTTSLNYERQNNPFMR